jgi:hypothetical protein
VATNTVDKWQDWIKGAIKGDVISMHADRATWRHVQSMLGANDQLPESIWWNLMHDTYATTQAVAVRRQAVPDRDSRNLGTLLAELSDDCSLITREFWVGMWDVTPTDPRHTLAAGIWTKQFAGTVGSHVDPAIVHADVARLRADSDAVKRYVDRHIAHSDRRATTINLPSLSDVHDAIDSIGEIFRRYYNLLTAASMLQLEPTVLWDWMAVFRQAWMPAGWDG